MRTLERNKQTFYYALFDSDVSATDPDGNKTGEYIAKYKEPVKMRANISPASGDAQREQFGTMLEYDRVIVTDDIHCPIDENTVLFIDRPPKKKEDGTLLYDYIVKRVAKSLNTISFAVSKVDIQ